MLQLLRARVEKKIPKSMRVEMDYRSKLLSSLRSLLLLQLSMCTGLLEQK